MACGGVRSRDVGLEVQDLGCNHIFRRISEGRIRRFQDELPRLLLRHKTCSYIMIGFGVWSFNSRLAPIPFRQALGPKTQPSSSSPENPSTLSPEPDACSWVSGCGAFRGCC